MPDEMTYLNLGCGSRYQPGWINIDIVPQSPEVIQHDLSRGVPLPDASCDVVYHAAVLEHLRCADAETFLGECFRVLKPGGVVRVGVPDLEKICRLYLSKLSTALNGDQAAAHGYDWMLLELLDQSVRESSGGAMRDYLRKNPLPNEAFVYERIGEEGRQLVKALREHQNPDKRSFASLIRKLQAKLPVLSGAIKQRVVFWLLGSEEKRALKIGRFRLSGEVHQWMYDRYSLARLLERTGFLEPQLHEANTSRIPNWDGFHLDTLPDGQAVKPDLFFMEAIKPEAVTRD